jgi:hypothetical protein
MARPPFSNAAQTLRDVTGLVVSAETMRMGTEAGRRRAIDVDGRHGPGKRIASLGLLVVLGDGAH